ncbi:unnamed protein product [Closterium sp. Yama58-4]|nr:unnamed protein product [Closterium sp. Yama58-4]
MARKRKGLALNDCTQGLCRHPRGLSAPPVLDGQGSSAQSPTAAPSRVRRQPARTAATHRPVVEEDDAEEDDDEGDDEVASDDEEEEPEDLGMSPSDDYEDDDEDAEEDAPEEAQPVAPPPKRSTARKAGSDKGKGKAAQPAASPEPRKKRAAAPVERGLWFDKESTISPRRNGS